MGQEDAAAGRGLPGDRQIGVADDGRFSDETDDAAHSENACPRPPRIDAGAKRTRPAVIEVRDLDDRAAPPTLCPEAKAFSPPKCILCTGRARQSGLEGKMVDIRGEAGGCRHLKT